MLIHVHSQPKDLLLNNLRDYFIAESYLSWFKVNIVNSAFPILFEIYLILICVYYENREGGMLKKSLPLYFPLAFLKKKKKLRLNWAKLRSNWN